MALKSLIDEAQAPCWAPDAPSEGPAWSNRAVALARALSHRARRSVVQRTGLTCTGRAFPTCLAPATIFLGVFFLYPFVLVAVEAFSRDGVTTLENFRTMVGHQFPEAFRNTLLAAVVVPVQLALALHGDDRHRSPPGAARSSTSSPSRSAWTSRRADLARDPRAVGLPQQLAYGARHHRPAGDVPRLPEQARPVRRRGALAEIWRRPRS